MGGVVIVRPKVVNVFIEGRMMEFKEFNKKVCEIMDVDHNLNSSEYDYIYGLCGTEEVQFNNLSVWSLKRLEAIHARVCNDD